MNSNGCLVLSEHMTGVNAKIKGLFNRLLITDIALSQANFESVRRDEWPSGVERIFKLALWQAKRIEYLEKFWQVRLERLRLFKIISDEVGNTSSRFIALALAGLSIGASYIVWDQGGLFHPSTLALIATAWYLGWLTRKPEYSFGMDAIVRQGFGGSWVPFSSLRYYDSVAQQYGGCKAQIQIYILQGMGLVLGGPGQQRPRQGE